MEKQKDRLSVSGINNFLLLLAVILIFSLGLGIRLYDLTDLPLDFHPARQLHSALISRGMYYQTLDTASDFQRDLAVEQWKGEGLIEPQILENLSAMTYRLVGGVYLWIPRLYSILFWILGGVALYFLAKDFAGKVGAILTIMFYLFAPYTVPSSRAFMPDPLMTCLIILAFLAATRWLRSEQDGLKNSWGWAITAGILTGLAIYSKSVAGFFLAAIWISLVLFGIGFRHAIRSPRVLVIIILSLLPSILYYIYGTLVLHLLEGQFSLRFFPQLWKDPAFYLRWLNEVKGVVGFGWLLIALLGSLVVRDRTLRSGLIGWWIGYVVFGFVFAYHISSHDYYSLPIVPAAALGIGVAGEILLSRLQNNSRLIKMVSVIILMAGVILSAWDARTELKRKDYRSQAETWNRTGQQFSPQDSIVALSQNYGYNLAYWGWRRYTYWSTTGDNYLRELGEQNVDFLTNFQEKIKGADYFLVTDFGEFDRQPQLKLFLQENYPLIKQDPEYWIYNLQDPFDS